MELVSTVIFAVRVSHSQCVKVYKVGDQIKSGSKLSSNGSGHKSVKGVYGSSRLNRKGPLP